MENKLQITNSGLDLLNALKAREGTARSIQTIILANVYDNPLTSDEIVTKCLTSGLRANPGIILSFINNMLRSGLITNASYTQQVIDMTPPAAIVEKTIKKSKIKRVKDVKELNEIISPVEEDELRYATRYEPLGEYKSYYCYKCGIEVDDPYRCPRCGGKVNEETRSIIIEDDIGGNRL
jgi:rubrerythrin